MTLTEDANILRAMIDSSEHVTEPTKMIGFDLEKARAADEALPYPLDANEIWVSGKGQMHINPPNAPSIFFTLSDLCEFRNLFHGQAAEIERLLAALVEHEEHENQTHEVLGNILGTDDTLENVAKRAAARIKELEDALVDELVKQQFWCGVIPSMDERKMVARQRLRAEGKIGPDADAKPREGLYGKYRISKADGSPVDPNADYFVLRLDTDPVARRAAREYSYMTVDRKLALELQKRITRYNPKMMDCINLQFFGVEKPRVWQITEERMRALSVILGYISYDADDDIEICSHAAVLRAMLREAE